MTLDLNSGLKRNDLMAALADMKGDFLSTQELIRKTQASGGVDTRGLIARIDALEAELDRRPTRTEALNIAQFGVEDGAGDMPQNPAAAAIRQYARSGSVPQNLSSTVGGDGGYLVVPQYADEIMTKTFDVSPIARYATRVNMTEGNSLEIPIGVNLPGAQWAGENETRTVQTGPTFGMQKIPVFEIYSMVQISQILLDDSHYDLDAFLMNAINTKFATSIGAAFVNGNTPGTTPTGILQSTFAATEDEVRAWGTLQYFPSGAAGAFVSADALVDLCYKLRAPYRTKARWFMNRKTAALVRKFKDSTGAFIWAAGIAAGQPDLLLGYPVELDEQLPDIAANSYSILFGDMAQAFTMPVRNDVNFLRDPYTVKGQLLLYATARVGGAVVNSEAIKALKFSVA